MVPESRFVPVKQAWSECLHDGHDLNFVDVEIGGQRHDGMDDFSHIRRFHGLEPCIVHFAFLFVPHLHKSKFGLDVTGDEKSNVYLATKQVRAPVVSEVIDKGLCPGLHGRACAPLVVCRR